jgi:sporulation protein YlmC with PRC-barrel domain
MNRIVPVAASLLLCLGTSEVLAQQPLQDGGMAIGVVELSLVAPAWSARKDIMGKPVYNEQDERIGRIDDIIITPDNAVSFAVIGTGGFLGIGKHDVVIPVGRIQSQNGKYVLPGATKTALKALPAFKYKG